MYDKEVAIAVLPVVGGLSKKVACQRILGNKNTDTRVKVQQLATSSNCNSDSKIVKVH
jgi:hypothetical protein